MFSFPFQNLRFFTTFLVAHFLMVYVGEVQADEPEDNLGSSESIGDEQREEAKAYFEQGSAHFSKGEYQEAIDKFQKAYEIVRSGEILYNIGRCYEALGDADQAIYNYEMYLRFFPTADDVGDVKHRIAVLREIEATELEADETEDQPEDESEAPEEHWYDGLGIGARLGFTWSPVGPAHGASIPIELFGTYPINDFLSAALAVDFGRYINKYAFPTYAPEGQFGVRVGLMGDFELSEAFSIILGFDIGIRRLTFAPDHRWNWFLGHVRGGINYRLGESNWVLVAEILCGLGPAWSKDDTDVIGTSTNLDRTPQLQVETGGKVGIKFVF